MKISIFGKLIGMIVLAIVLTSAALFLTTNHFVTQGFDEKTLEELTGFKNAVDAEIQDMQVLLTTVGSLMAQNSEVAQSIYNNRWRFLQEFAQQVIQQTGIDFLTISNQQGIVIARGHSDQKGDSVLNQVNVQKALQEDQPSVGIETGTVVKFSLRAGYPVKIGDTIVGVVTASHLLELMCGDPVP